MKKFSSKVALSLIIALIFGAVYFYITLPAINIFDQAFWFFLILTVAVFGISFFVLTRKNTSDNEKKHRKIGIIASVIAICAFGLVLLVGNIGSSTLFNAERYSNIIEVTESVFEEDMPETNVVSNIALMDSATAQKMGEKTLGALSDVVSQYEINSTYRQINYKGAPQKIASLEYADFFRWLNNREKGIPGYVMVDPVNVTTAEYIKLSSPIKYTESGFFNDNLQRQLRFSHPTKIFGSYSFELDDNGNPYYIVSCLTPSVFMFGAMDVSEVIIFDPINGSSNIYSVSETPSWVDIVFTGDLASEKFDWYGTLKNGFWNSIIGKKDCKVTTDDYGYIVLEDDVWYFTGVTSVTSDESNIGFIISNARTGEYKFYPVIGAEEYSAMSAAEGEVQEKGYVASFPSLINISGEATYIMVLKDTGGLVKLYALVNVESYGIVATGTTQTEAKQKYIKLLAQNNISDGNNEAVQSKTQITVTNIRTVVSGGESVMYLTANDGNLYKQTVSADESIMLINIGDVLSVSYTETDIKGIRLISYWEIYNGEKK